MPSPSAGLLPAGGVPPSRPGVFACHRSPGSFLQVALSYCRVSWRQWRPPGRMTRHRMRSRRSRWRRSCSSCELIRGQTPITLCFSGIKRQILGVFSAWNPFFGGLLVDGARMGGGGTRLVPEGRLSQTTRTAPRCSAPSIPSFDDAPARHDLLVPRPPPDRSGPPQHCPTRGRCDGSGRGRGVMPEQAAAGTWGSPAVGIPGTGTSGQHPIPPCHRGGTVQRSALPLKAALLLLGLTGQEQAEQGSCPAACGHRRFRDEFAQRW